MTMFIRLENNAPVGSPIVEGNFRLLFPNTSFPKYFTAEVVEPLGYGIYDYSNPPAVSHYYQKVVEVEPIRSDVGIWRQTWTTMEMDDAEKTKADEAIAASNRSTRDALLASSDWTQVADAPVDATAWATYRQALRDITAHANWPHLTEADWPVKPE